MTERQKILNYFGAGCLILGGLLVSFSRTVAMVLIMTGVVIVWLALRNLR